MTIKKLQININTTVKKKNILRYFFSFVIIFPEIATSFQYWIFQTSDWFLHNNFTVFSHFTIIPKIIENFAALEF